MRSAAVRAMAILLVGVSVALPAALVPASARPLPLPGGDLKPSAGGTSSTTPGTSGTRPATPRRDPSIPAPSAGLVRAALADYAAGPNGGQCKGWVQILHSYAGRGMLGPGYTTAYAKAGYVRVTSDQARRGDIIQFYWDEWSTDYGIHTAILLERPHDGGAQVIDSNWVEDEKIGIHWLDIVGRVSANRGLKVTYWRWAG